MMWAQVEPASGQPLATIEAISPAQVEPAVSGLRAVQQRWSAVPVAQRSRCLQRLAARLVARRDTLVDLLSRECGKPRMEALVHEVLVAADMAKHWARIAPRVLRPTPRALRRFRHRRAVLHPVPRGVVAVISPWNYPLVISLSETMAAVVAGNAVAIKPSEWTPRTVACVESLFAEAGCPPGLVRVLHGDAAVGKALIESRPDLVVFTGSVANGRAIAGRCGELLIPTLLELGGKAPAVVLADADIESTARSLVWGAFVHAGQVCVSVERVYVAREIYASLCQRVVALTESLRQGDPLDPNTDVGALTCAAQQAHLRRQISDACAKGARLLTGGDAVDRGQGTFFAPTVLADCDHSMAVMREETFGPVLPLMPVDGVDQALALANDSDLGLAAYAFGSRGATLRRVAGALQAGVVIANDVLIGYGLPEVPFGGVKSSGIGRVHGPEGLRAMTTTKHVNLGSWIVPQRWVQYPYSAAKLKGWQRAMRWLI